MRIIRIVISVVTLLFMIHETQAAIPQRKGWWKFDNPADLTKSETGYSATLSLTGTHFSADGPVPGKGAVLIGPGSYYKMLHKISSNGGGAYVNEYTLQYDFKIPELGVWHSFFQTSANNNNDGDYFINPSGNIGVAAVGYSADPVSPNEWYRLVISVKNGNQFTCYLDGKLWKAGNIQPIDGRFSLESTLLIFADDNGEDASIYCSELAIWDQTLTGDQVSELGGYSHEAGQLLVTRIPYLQGQGITTMTICWHDAAQNNTKVRYGIDSTLNNEVDGSSEIISDPYCWHTVKLTGLTPNRRYFYRVASGDGESGIYSFRTLPDSSFTGKIRFVLLSDTHATDTTMAGKVLRAARSKIAELYGPDIENHVNGVFHSGDIVMSGYNPGQYIPQFFKPLSALSPNIPTMVVAGNHEAESPYFYKYLKLEGQSAFPNTPALSEKMWQLRAGNSLFIGLNTNIMQEYGDIELDWLDAQLNEAENDPGIYFVFMFFHHPPFSELWVVGGTDYVKNRLLPVIMKYTKVQEIHYGHTHGFERGTLTSAQPGGDLRIICGGGGGGPLDPWVAGENQDFNDIQVCISNYHFQILEIDIANHSYKNSMYSLGTLNSPKNSELMDTWHRSLNQAGPETPRIENIDFTGDFVQFTTSGFSGIDSLMSVQFQVVESSPSSKLVVDSTRHWENIYNIDQNLKPVDQNRGINLYQSRISKSLLTADAKYLFRVRYRDQNLKWSNWSELTWFNTVGIADKPDQAHGYFLDQNFPNPFRDKTTISYSIPETGDVIFHIYDGNHRRVADISEGIKTRGNYQLNYTSDNLSEGIYYYELVTKNASITRKMIKSLSGK